MGIGSEPVPLQREHGAGGSPGSAGFRFPLPPHAAQRGRGGVRRITRGAAMNPPSSRMKAVYPYDGVITDPADGAAEPADSSWKHEGRSVRDRRDLPGPAYPAGRPSWT
jgi:hypothetical protein